MRNSFLDVVQSKSKAHRVRGTTRAAVSGRHVRTLRSVVGLAALNRK